LGVQEVETIFDSAGCRGALHAVRLSDRREVAVGADESWVMASIVKVPIALEFHAAAGEGRVDPSQEIVVPVHARTEGPVGISRFSDPVTASLRDLSYLMLTISDNAATDIVTAVVGVDAVNARLANVGCSATHVVGDLATMLDDTARDLGFTSYRELLAAQHGDLGPEQQRAATNRNRIDNCRALNPATASHTTARDMTTLLSHIWQDRGAPASACAAVRAAMAEQVTQRLAPVVPDGGKLAAKSGGLFGRVRNEIAVVTDPHGERFVLAILTDADRAFARQNAIRAAIVDACQVALDALAA
jgi:beta-lactamase class A